MPKGRGGKAKKRGRKDGGEQKQRDLITKGEGQEYAQVIKMLGSGRLEGKCADGRTRLCHIRGKMLNKIWINKDDVILVSLREFQDDKADVVHKYTMNEARKLKELGHYTDFVESKISKEDENGNDPFSFEDI